MRPNIPPCPHSVASGGQTVQRRFARGHEGAPNAPVVDETGRQVGKTEGEQGPRYRQSMVDGDEQLGGDGAGKVLANQLTWTHR